MDRADLEANPLAQFDVWFAQASAAQSGSRWRKIGIAIYKLWQAILGRSPADVNAMVLSTVDKNGRPSSRNVLLKGLDSRGFIFFTNYVSRKRLRACRKSKRGVDVLLAGTGKTGLRGGCCGKSFTPRNRKRISNHVREAAGSQRGLQTRARLSQTVPRLRQNGMKWKGTFPKKFPCPRTGAVLC